MRPRAHYFIGLVEHQINPLMFSCFFVECMCVHVHMLLNRTGEIREAIKIPLGLIYMHSQSVLKFSFLEDFVFSVLDSKSLILGNQIRIYYIIKFISDGVRVERDNEDAGGSAYDY